MNKNRQNDNSVKKQIGLKKSTCIPRSKQEIDKLIKDLLESKPKKPDNQWNAAIALGDSGSSDLYVVNALIKALSHSGALTRAHSAEALGKIGNNAAIKPLIKALKDDYRLVRAYAAKSLGLLGGESVIPHLIETLETDDFYGAKAEAAEAIGVICKDSDSQPCKKARKVLKTQGKKEEKEKSKGYIRVTREITRSLEELGEILADMGDQAAALAKEAKKKGDPSFAKKASRLRKYANQAIHCAKGLRVSIQARPV